MALTEKEVQILAHLEARNAESAEYQTNITNFETMLVALPEGAWPEKLAGFKGVPVANLPEELSDQDVALISDYQYRDHLRVRVRTEKAEKSKVDRLIDALKQQVVDFDVKFAEYVANK